MPVIKVLHVLSDLDPGGAQVAVLDMVRHIDRARFQPHVCCLRTGGALVGKLNDMAVPFHLCYFGSRYSPLGLWRLVGLIRGRGFHIVHTHLRRANHVGRLAAVLAGAPVICAHHHDTILEHKWYHRALTRWLGPRTDHIFCVSNEVRGARLAAGDEPEERMEVLHNFIEPAEYRDPVPPAVMKAELGLPADRPVVGIVGRLHPFKNHELFLQAAKELAGRRADVHFAIVGDGSLRSTIAARIQELGLADRVTLTGMRSDMPRVYRALDALVLCSTREGFGKVVLEAMASGVPVASLNVGGVSEMLAGGGGVLVPEPKPEAFAAALEHILEPAERQRLQMQAFQALGPFSATRIITEMEDVYLDLCEKKHAFRAPAPGVPHDAAAGAD